MKYHFSLGVCLCLLGTAALADNASGSPPATNTVATKRSPPKPLPGPVGPADPVCCTRFEIDTTLQKLKEQMQQLNQTREELRQLRLREKQEQMRRD